MKGNKNEMAQKIFKQRTEAKENYLNLQFDEKLDKANLK